MLDNKQKEDIRKLNIYQYAWKVKDGKAIVHGNEEFIIPSFMQIQESIFKQILDLGFSKIEIVEPNKANCIIRVFQKLNHIHDDFVYNVYGADCFTRKRAKWVSMAGGNEFEINYSKCSLMHWICQDEYINFDCDFFDCYINIS